MPATALYHSNELLRFYSVFGIVYLFFLFYCFYRITRNPLLSRKSYLKILILSLAAFLFYSAILVNISSLSGISGDSWKFYSFRIVEGLMLVIWSATFYLESLKVKPENKTPLVVIAFVISLPILIVITFSILGGLSWLLMLLIRPDIYNYL